MQGALDTPLLIYNINKFKELRGMIDTKALLLKKKKFCFVLIYIKLLKNEETL